MSWEYSINSTGGAANIFYTVQQIVPFFSEACMIAIFIITFAALKNFETPKAFAASSFILTISALFFAAMGALNTAWLYGGIVLTSLSIVFLYFHE